MKETLDVKNGQTADMRVRVSVKGALKTDSRAGQRSETMEERNRKASLHNFSFAGTQM